VTLNSKFLSILLAAGASLAIAAHGCRPSASRMRPWHPGSNSSTTAVARERSTCPKRSAQDVRSLTPTPTGGPTSS